MMEGQTGQRPNAYTAKRRYLIVLYCVISLCAGSLYAWSVFAAPMAARLETDNLSLVYTVAVSVGPVPMFAGGYLQRIIGSRWLLILSSLLFGGGMFLSGFFYV